MRSGVAAFFLLLLTVFSPASAFAQDCIINEIYNSSGSDEWVELLVTKDSLDLRGWSIRDFSSAGAAQSPLIFASHAIWSNVRAGVLIVVGRPEVTFAEDTDPSDYLLVIKSNNASYFSGTVFSIAGSSEAVQVRDASSTHVFGASWGSANAASLPSPKVHFSGSSSSGTSVTYNGGDLAGLTTTANWTLSNATTSPGLGNSTANSAWIAAFRARADGLGSATVLPDTVYGGATVTFTITFRPDSQFPVTDLRILLPRGFQWSGSTADVEYTNMTATVNARPDTLTFNSISFSADSVVIRMFNVVVPDSTAYYPLEVQSKSAVQFADVAPLPKIVLFGVPVPIAEVKVNDANGIGLRNGQLATVRGIVTAAQEFGGPSYVMDNSGGMSIFGRSLSPAGSRSSTD